MTRKSLFFLSRWAILLAVLSMLFRPQSMASAHPVDMYAQTQAILLTPAGLQVDWKITPGPLLADAIWDSADQDKDGSVSQAEAQAWAAPVLAQWGLTIDGQPVGKPSVQAVQWPASIDPFRTGEDSIRIRLFFNWPAGETGRHALDMHNSFQEANSLNWFSLSAQTPFSFDEPQQSGGELATQLAFSSGGAAAAPTQTAAALTSWNSGVPSLPGLTGAVSNLAANLANPAQSPQPQQPGAAPATATTALVGLVKTQQFSAWFLVGALLLSMALGSLHALTPGHGKALVAAYLVGSQGKTREAIVLGLIVTVTHTGSVVLLGLLTLLASHYILPSLIAPWLEVCSGLLVIAFGINLFIQRRAVITAWLRSRWKPKPAGNVYRLGGGTTITLQGAAVVAQAHAPGLLPHEHEHTHTHAGVAHDHAAHGHDHALPAGQITLRSLLTLGISGGLVPCPDAIAILLVAVAINRILFGMVLIVAFSIGLAAVLIGIGIAMVQGLRFIERSDLINRFSAYTPIVSAVVVTGLGVGLTLSAVNSFTLTATAQGPNQTAGSQQATSQAVISAGIAPTPTSGAPFDIRHARLAYLYPDAQRQNQLLVMPLAGGRPVTYTGEAAGVAGYTLSPDQKSILYTVINASGESSLWSIDTDGAGKKLVLDCPQSECDGPVWVPGTGQKKLVYERLNYSTAASSSVFSIWWLDPQSGETKPVFQDQAFPGIAPGFSPDGGWLSYISPLNNTIQLYNLQGGRNQSISLPVGYQPRIQRPWNPLGGSILYWGAVAAGTGSTTLHVRKYDLASGQSIDLSAATGEIQFEAAWSPDGQWVAIARDSSGPGAPNQRQQIWLVHPDGSGGHVVVDEQYVSYSNLDWSADSQFLAYSRYSTKDPGKPEIWLADLVAGKQTRLVQGGILPTLLP